MKIKRRDLNHHNIDLAKPKSGALINLFSSPHYSE